MADLAKAGASDLIGGSRGRDRKASSKKRLLLNKAGSPKQLKGYGFRGQSRRESLAWFVRTILL